MTAYPAPFWRTGWVRPSREDSQPTSQPIADHHPPILGPKLLRTLADTHSVQITVSRLPSTDHRPGGHGGIRTHDPRLCRPVPSPLGHVPLRSGFGIQFSVFSSRYGAFQTAEHVLRSLVERPGFEPGYRPCDGRVLPLHHRPTSVVAEVRGTRNKALLLGFVLDAPSSPATSFWLRRRDSNPHLRRNRPACCRYTTPHLRDHQREPHSPSQFGVLLRYRLAGRGIEPRLQAYETRQTPRPSHPLQRSQNR